MHVSKDTIANWYVQTKLYKWFSWDMASLPEGKSQGVFGALVCKIQAKKCYIESLPLVLKDKK